MWMPGILALVLCAALQDGAPPAFEAASVKMNTGGAGDSHSSTRPANLQLTNMPLRAIITMAYQVKDYQLEGPSWLASERYDIVAKAASGTPEQQLFAMLKTLLAERFNLKAHSETKEMQVDALVATKSGFRLKPVEPGDSSRQTDHNARGGVLTATRTSM